VAVQAKGSKRPRARPKRAPGSRLTQGEIDEIFRRFHHVDPNPKTELHYRDPFTLLVAVVLSAQATDASVNRATPELFRIADTPQKLAQLGEAGLEANIKTIGLYRSKARNLIALANKLVAEHGSKVPETREVLMSLPGVGRKTANLVMILGFKSLRNICVDTHVHRISNRLGWVKTKLPDETEQALYKATDSRWWPYINLYLVTWGQNVCRPIGPRCRDCVIAEVCPKIGVRQRSAL